MDVIFNEKYEFFFPFETKNFTVLNIITMEKKVTVQKVKNSKPECCFVTVTFAF